MFAALGTILLIVIFLWLLIVSKAFRWAVVVLVVIAVVLISILMNYLEQQTRDGEIKRARKEAVETAAERERWQKINVDDLEFREAKLRRLYGDRQSFAVNLRNKSEHDLSGLSVIVRLYDCSGNPRKDYSNCEIIGEESAYVEAEIPALQTRQVTHDFQFKNTPSARRLFAWNYEIRGVRTQ